MRKHKVSVAFYDNNFEPHVVTNIVLSEKEALNSVAVDFSVPIKAIIINHDDHAYAKVRFD